MTRLVLADLTGDRVACLPNVGDILNRSHTEESFLCLLWKCHGDMEFPLRAPLQLTAKGSFLMFRLRHSTVSWFCYSSWTAPLSCTSRDVPKVGKTHTTVHISVKTCRIKCYQNSLSESRLETLRHVLTDTVFPLNVWPEQSSRHSDGLRFGHRFFAKERYFALPHIYQTGWGSSQTPAKWVVNAFSPWAKRHDWTFTTLYCQRYE
jgi:hypothetical protein